MQAFDQVMLTQFLAPLDRFRLSIFASGCATRTLFIFHGFPNSVMAPEGAELAALLESLWNQLGSDSFNSEQLCSNANSLERMMPPEVSSALLEYYADAIGAVLSATLAASRGELVYAVHAALAVQEIVARYIKQTSNLKHQTGQAFLEEISAFALMETECVRQLRDAQFLQTVCPAELSPAREAIRSRAFRESCLPIHIIERLAI